MDGQYHSHPFGKDAQGVISYSPGGRMSAILMRPGRALFEKASLLQATAEELRLATAGYVSYAGRWRVEGEQVVHSVDFSLLPNWIGVDLVRTISWTDGEPAQLILSTDPVETSSGKKVVNRLRWGRSKP